MIPWRAIFAFYCPLALVSVFVITYGLLLRRLATIAHPHRLRLAELGEKYLVVCKTPEERALIKFYLDKAFSPWVAASACVLFPIVLFQEIFWPRRGKFNFVPTDEDAHNKICRLAVISMFAANPIFGSLVALQLISATAIVALISGNITLIKRAISAIIDSQASTTRVDRRITAH
jgi:hypothetical protein